MDEFFCLVIKTSAIIFLDIVILSCLLSRSNVKRACKLYEHAAKILYIFPMKLSPLRV